VGESFCFPKHGDDEGVVHDPITTDESNPILFDRLRDRVGANRQQSNQLEAAMPSIQRQGNAVPDSGRCWVSGGGTAPEGTTTREVGFPTTARPRKSEEGTSQSSKKRQTENTIMVALLGVLSLSTDLCVYPLKQGAACLTARYYAKIGRSFGNCRSSGQ